LYGVNETNIVEEKMMISDERGREREGEKCEKNDQFHLNFMDSDLSMIDSTQRGNIYEYIERKTERIEGIGEG
jgi:hypothetical protein